MNNNTDISFDNTEDAFSYKSMDELKNARFVFSSAHYQIISKLGTNFIKVALKLGLPVKYIVKKTIFSHFCGGESLEDSKKTVLSLRQYDVGTILDYSVEGLKSEEGFEITCNEIMRSIEISAHYKNPFCVFKVTGLGSSSLLEKVQKNVGLSDSETKEFERIKERINRVCQYAFKFDIAILIDAEESWIQDCIDSLAYHLMEKYNKQRAIVYNTYQMYRHDMMGNLQVAMLNAAKGRYFVGAKIVRGAYMEKERERATEMNYPDPIQPDKHSTDSDFNNALKFCLDNKQRIFVLCGSHNEYSNYYLTVLMKKHGLKNSDPRVFFSQLYGMSDNISFNLAKAGYNVAKYLPYGPVELVLPYLFRRVNENTAIGGQISRELLLIRSEIQRRKALN